MEECSLQTINNEPCHERIRAGDCLGFVKGTCTNHNAIKILSTRYEREARNEVIRRRAEERERRDSFPSHFVDQSDPLVKRVRKTVESTLITISNCMERIRKANFRKIHRGVRG